MDWWMGAGGNYGLQHSKINSKDIDKVSLMGCQTLTIYPVQAWLDLVSFVKNKIKISFKEWPILIRSVCKLKNYLGFWVTVCFNAVIPNHWDAYRCRDTNHFVTGQKISATRKKERRKRKKDRKKERKKKKKEREKTREKGNIFWPDLLLIGHR